MSPARRQPDGDQPGRRTRRTPPGRTGSDSTLAETTPAETVPRGRDREGVPEEGPLNVTPNHEAEAPPTEGPKNHPQSRHERNEETEDWVPSDLSYQQARTALDLLLAELQSSDLQVEEMLSLYRRAQSYADHCQAVLQRVDQDVIEWDLLQHHQESNG